MVNAFRPKNICPHKRPNHYYHFTDNVALTVVDKLKLFDCIILPILNYGSVIWGFHDAGDIEKVHLRFL
jgi:hypothetical protein